MRKGERKRREMWEEKEGDGRRWKRNERRTKRKKVEEKKKEKRRKWYGRR